MSNTLKLKVAKHLVSLLPDHGIIAMGSGTTVNAIITELSNIQTSLRFVSASRSTSLELQKHGLPEVPLAYAMQQGTLLCIDGADQVLPSNPHLIVKGHGGALVQEKVMWTGSSSVWVAIDESKLANSLSVSVPIAIIPNAFYQITKELNRWEMIDHHSLLRKGGLPYNTDEGNYILHLHMTDNVNLEDVAPQLKALSGVVDTGIFGEILTQKSTVYCASEKGVDII